MGNSVEQMTSDNNACGGDEENDDHIVFITFTSLYADHSVKTCENKTYTCQKTVGIDISAENFEMGEHSKNPFFNYYYIRTMWQTAQLEVQAARKAPMIPVEIAAVTKE